MSTRRGDAFDEQFFERQRREITARIAAHEARRRARRAALPLAAAFLAGAVLLGIALHGPGSTPAPAPAPGENWLFAWELPVAVTGGDPLASYAGELPDAAQSAESSTSTDVDPLPPLGDMDERSAGVTL